MTLHIKDGLHFKRLLDGGVRVFRTTAKSADGRELETLSLSVDLTASEWATVVTAVSQRGTEYPGSHAEILELHQRD